MNHETFFENFGFLVDAPNGMEKLREIILQLAIQGKLVPQNSNDEPASVLLMKIRAEKERLVKDKKIRLEKTLPPINKIPYELPKSWNWCKLGETVISYKNDIVDGPFGSNLKANEYIDIGIPIIRLQNIERNNFLNKNIKYISEKKADFLKRHSFKKGDIVISKLGNPAGKACIVPSLFNYGIIVADVVRIRDRNYSIEKRYITYMINSPFVAGQFKKQATGTTRQRVNLAKIRELIIPIPPLEEQKRIVVKVDQLMTLCDELEARQLKKHEQRIRLNNAALDKLLTALTPDEFAQHWQRICDNFNLLYDVPETVRQLRQGILQLAVQGKLVAQDEGDEPAAVLLEKIKTIKERLVKEGKIRKSNFLPSIREDEKHFKLPTGWQWVRFDDICSYIQRGKGPKYVEKSDIPVVSQKCIQWDGFKLDRAKFISPSTLEKYNEERFLITGDLLWNSTGTGTIGRINVYVHEDNSYDKIVADSHVTVIRPILINSRFIYYWIASPIIQNEIEEMASGTTNQIELNLSTIKNHLVPIPPLDEQKRIVDKVDQLMVLSNELEAGLVRAQTEGGKLMEDVVHHVLAA